MSFMYGCKSHVSTDVFKNFVYFKGEAALVHSLYPMPKVALAHKGLLDLFVKGLSARKSKCSIDNEHFKDNYLKETLFRSFFPNLQT